MSYRTEARQRIAVLAAEVGRPHTRPRQQEDFTERLVRDALWCARQTRWRFWTEDARVHLRSARAMHRSWHFDRMCRRVEEATARGDHAAATALVEQVARFAGQRVAKGGKA